MTPSVVAVHVWPADRPAPVPVDVLTLDWGGPIGDRHHGTTTESDSRQKHVFERGTRIFNHRQVSIVDSAELQRIAEAMGIEGIAPGLIADNICTTGFPDLTSLERMTRMVFSSGVVLMLGGENFPCAVAADLVGDVHGTSRRAFTSAALGRRGVTGWVEHPGTIRPGDRISLVAP